MPEFRIILKGPPYAEPRYYGELGWNQRNVYIRYAGGGKDSRHSDGRTFLATTGANRAFEQRLATSAVTRELLNFISLRPPLSEPPRLNGLIRKKDLVLETSSAGTAPRIAVEIVASSRVKGVMAAWDLNSTVCRVCTCFNNGLGPSLDVVLPGLHGRHPSLTAT